MQLGPLEIAVVIVIVIVAYGAGRLGELGAALGSAVRQFKAAVRGEDSSTPSG